MPTLARLTAILLIFIGLLTLVGGGYLVWRGLTMPEPFLAGLLGDPGDPAMVFVMKLLTGVIVAIQGLILAAAGEALWLVAVIARSHEEQLAHLATLAARGSMTIP